VELPSAAVALPEELAGPLRTGPDPVVGHVQAGRLLLDLLAVPPEDDARIVAAVRALHGT
jgi:L-seryl-tRNA(Ser) seleniumtransferase